MKKILLFSIIVIICTGPIFSEMLGIGVHAGIGTDITFGIAAGGGISYLITKINDIDLEGSVDFFYSHSVDNYTEGIYDYEYIETTDTAILAVLANALFYYNPYAMNLYFLTGLGVAGVGVDWEICSDDDETANDSRDYQTGGMLINLGVGLTLGGGFDIRLQTPVFIVFAQDETRFAPLFVIVAGVRF